MADELGGRLDIGFLAMIVGVVSSAAAADPSWHVVAHDDGCVGLEKLARAEGLTLTPRAPEEFAQLLRERGFAVEIGFPDGFPEELRGQVKQVRYDGKGPVFVTESVCRHIGGEWEAPQRVSAEK